MSTVEEEEKGPEELFCPPGYSSFNPCAAPADQAYPCINKPEHSDIWYTVGEPSTRVEPHWRNERWWLAAPVDFVGLEKCGGSQKHSDSLQMVDSTLGEARKQGNLPQLPRPNHVENASDCPIS